MDDATAKALKAVADKNVVVRLGTVVSNGVSLDKTRVVLDNDDSSTPVSALGTDVRYPAGTRVACLAYPKKGLLVIGAIGDSTLDSGWIEVGSAGAPAFENGWVNYVTGGWATCAFRKIGNRVTLRGLVKNGTVNAVIFTLPAGYRPLYGNIMFNMIVDTNTISTSVTITGLAGGPSPNVTGAASTGTAHTHSLSGHNHGVGSLAGTGSGSLTNTGCRLDIRPDGTVLQVGAVSNSFQSLNCSFLVD